VIVSLDNIIWSISNYNSHKVDWKKLNPNFTFTFTDFRQHFVIQVRQMNLERRMKNINLKKFPIGKITSANFKSFELIYSENTLPEKRQWLGKHT